VLSVLRHPAIFRVPLQGQRASPMDRRTVLSKAAVRIADADFSLLSPYDTGM
jgi:hypothetical protein